MKIFGFCQNFIRQIMCYITFILLVFALEAHRLFHHFTIYDVDLRDINICYLIICIVYHITYWVDVILIVIYVALLWNARVRFGTINECLK